MLFHVEIMARNNFGPADAPSVRERLGKQINVIMKSGKVKDSGIYADKRGGFLVLEINASEELQRLFAPIMDAFCVCAHPIVSIEALPKLFQELAK